MHIKEVAKALKEANLSIKPTKCKWFAEEIHLLGHNSMVVELDQMRVRLKKF